LDCYFTATAAQHRHPRHLPATGSAFATDSVKNRLRRLFSDDGGFLNPPQCRRRQSRVQSHVTRDGFGHRRREPPPPAAQRQLDQLPPASAVFDGLKPLRKRAHNHYLPAAMNLSELRVSPIGFYFANLFHFVSILQHRRNNQQSSSQSVEQLRCRLLSNARLCCRVTFKCLTSLLPIVGDRITCPMVLDPLEINCNGTIAVELAVAIAEFRPAANDELELRIGDYVALTS
uniref:SH3 domain-containing protein n=1 Tax=Macrostomum lignano TaxID=282301 RepID=A0A1I8F803_9PLAT